MRPDTSNWRDDRSYDFLDALPIEGLAWECLRRHLPYQDHYATLVDLVDGDDDHRNRVDDFYLEIDGA